MAIEFKVDGIDATTHAFLQRQADIIGGTIRACEETAVHVAASAKSEHEHGSNPHAIGRFETQTGQLVRSIHVGHAQIAGDAVEVPVAAGTDYAAYVELGTSRTRAYPFMIPALYMHKSTLRRLLKQHAGI